MASIEITVCVDSDGNFRVEADACEAFDNIEPGLAVRKVVLNVEIDEPEAQEVEVGVAAQADGSVKITAA